MGRLSVQLGDVTFLGSSQELCLDENRYIQACSKDDDSAVSPGVLSLYVNKVTVKCSQCKSMYDDYDANLTGFWFTLCQVTLTSIYFQVSTFKWNQIILFLI